MLPTWEDHVESSLRELLPHEIWLPFILLQLRVEILKKKNSYYITCTAEEDNNIHHLFIVATVKSRTGKDDLSTVR